MGYEPAEGGEYISETYGGEWVKKQPVEPQDAAMAVPDKPVPGKSPTEKLEFAENPNSVSERGQKAVEELSNQLETVAQPAIDAMIETIRAEFAEARDYDDLILRLARLSGEMGVDDLATALQQGSLLAQFEGVDSVDG